MNTSLGIDRERPSLETEEDAERAPRARLEERAASPVPARGQALSATPTPALVAEKAKKEESGARPSPAWNKSALNKVVVSAYKLFGFGVLTAILVGLLSYLAENVFYYVSTSWVVPMALSPADEHVLKLDSMASQELAAKGALVTQKLQLGAQLNDARRVVETEQSFQEAFRAAIGTDLRDRKAELAQLGSLLRSYQQSKANVVRSNDAYSGMSRDNLASQFNAHVIDRDEMLAGNYQIAQIATVNLGLDAKHVEISTQAAELKRQIASLESAQIASRGAKSALASYSYEVLRIRREFDQSLLASAKAEDEAAALAQSIAALDQVIGQHDRMLETIRHSPYMMAADKSFNMAFVPYDNRARVQVGSPVYGCRFGFVFCTKVGAVDEVVDGEVVGRHPLHNKDVRGVMVRINLADSKWIERAALFVGGRPLLF
jgi:hypothetical protein